MEAQPMTLEVNIPDVHAEVTAAFHRYEDALVNNKVEVLDEIFWNHPTTLRYGVTENLHSYQEICEFRASRPSQGLMRTLGNTRITTYGRDFAVANTEFKRPPGDRIGRQSQTWIRTPEGWRVVSAHVSIMIEPK
jgi:hypothetical protein